jgi:nucleotide-binding universal stress UspA family protein
MSEILVGIDDSAGTEDALAFARRLADATGARLQLASAYPYEEWPSRVASHEFGAFLRDEAQSVLDRRAASLGDDAVPTHAIADHSPARALHGLAEHIGAAVIVVGSTHRGVIGRVLPGSTGERLMHGSPCPVAIAPRGYAAQGSAPIGIVGVGYDTSDESEAALRAACRVARSFNAHLRVIRVFDATRVGTPALMTFPGWEAYNQDYEQDQSEVLERTVATLPDDVSAEAMFIAGRPGSELATQSQDVDLMIVGSRAYGPMAAVMLGGATHALIRDAACPVVVLPRGTESGLDVLFRRAQAAAS